MKPLTILTAAMGSDAMEFVLLLFFCFTGCIFFGVAIAGVTTGSLFTSFGRVLRKETPVLFWLSILGQILIGSVILFISFAVVLGVGKS